MRSIGLRRITGDCLAAVIPLLIVGFLAFSKSSVAFSNNACNDATSQAEKVVDVIKLTLETQFKTTAAHAVDANVRQIGPRDKDLDMAGARTNIASLRRQMKVGSKQLDDSYLGIFVTDYTGAMYTGELASGEEYKGATLLT